MTEYKKMTVATDGKRGAVIVMPAGEYFIGDPCYSVPDEHWIPWLEAAEYQSVDTYALAATIDGHPVVGLGTAYGDGEYADDEGNLYGVDAGLIGLVPVALGTRYSDTRRVRFDAPVKVIMDGGVLHFGNISIDTDPGADTCDWCGSDSSDECEC